MKIPGLKRVFARAIRSKSTLPGSQTSDSAALASSSGPVEPPKPRIPIELLLRIFGQLSIVDVLRCRAACRWFKDVIDNAVEVQYKIELHVAGFRNNDACTDMAMPERLEALKAHTQFWKNPTFSWKSEDVPWAHGDLRYNHFHENLWVRSLRVGHVEHVWKFNAIQCVAIEPAADGSSVLDHWTLTFPFLFECYMSYPSRGYTLLLDSNNTDVPQRYIIRKVSLSNGTMLSENTVYLEGPNYEHWAGPVIDGSDGEYVSIVRSSPVPESDPPSALIRITILAQADCEVIVDTSITISDNSLIAVQLVRDNCFLLHIMRGGVFHTRVYAVKRKPFPNEDEHSCWLVATFEYPEVQSSFVKDMHDMNFIVGGSGGGVLSRNVPPRPFIRAADNPPLMVLRWYQREDGSQSRVIHVVPLSVYVSAADSFDPSRQEARQTDDITKWRAWGPANTRCFLDHKSFLPGNFGHQMLLSDFSLVDFNPLEITRDLNRVAYLPPAVPEAPRSRRSSMLRALRAVSRTSTLIDDIEIAGCSGRIVRYATTIAKGEMFSEDVTTSLPYRKTKIEWTGPEPVFVYAGEVWVVCSKENAGAGGPRYKFHTLQKIL
ncbi:hypothetical protein BDW22DRAFT_1431484 [Trametopsis cervina]|nr:hypothetical protein BDW22DRAFT_1431484 [Trametopsis cervina]